METVCWTPRLDQEARGTRHRCLWIRHRAHNGPGSMDLRKPFQLTHPEALPDGHLQASLPTPADCHQYLTPMLLVPCCTYNRHASQSTVASSVVK